MMEKLNHLKLPVFKDNVERHKRSGGGGYSLPSGRSKSTFAQQASQRADELTNIYSELKQKYSGEIDPSLIYEIEINQAVYPESFDKTLSSMGIHVLSVAEGKKGFWIVFNDNDNLEAFKNKLADYGSEDGPKYDFFNAIESFQNIPIEKKIGQRLKDNPLCDVADFIDIELWKMADPQKNEYFIQQLTEKYTDLSQFKITDKLSTKSFVLLRIKLTKAIFDEIIEFNEIARSDRPSLPDFNPFEYKRPDISDIVFNEPSEGATGILIIDSGIISNHPMLEKCVGGEENFQSGEPELQDTVGHGTAVAGCAAYGNIEINIENKNFNPENWIFSAKVMYAERNDISGNVLAVYDPEKLIEHQFKDAVEYFLSNSEYHIKVVNISLGNSNEVWRKHYSRQLPFAALIDELAFSFPNVTFIVSAGNQHPKNMYNTIQEIVDNYPAYLTDNDEFKIINPATSGLALTVGSIAGAVRIGEERYGAEDIIKTPVAKEQQPSPFTRTGAGLNGMIKPELVEYGGNLILADVYNRITDDIGGKIALLNNKSTEDIIKYDYGTSYSAPKVAYLAGKISNKYPQKSSNFIKNMLLIGSDYPFMPDKTFYDTKDKKKAETKHLSVSGFGLSNFDKAINSFTNRTVLWDEGEIALNQIKVYSLQLPDIFFNEKGKKKITVVLTFNPETRLTRGDSYLGNRMEFHLFHSLNPTILIEKYGVISKNTERVGVPEDIKKFEIGFFPGANTRKAGCHQKAWKDYKKGPKNRPAAPMSLVLLNFNKWINDDSRIQNYCVSVIFEHEKEIELYNEIRANIQARTRIR
ncbi:S8 family peptidase [Desulfococcaceae bacterium HSG9]|nr:S8 family peptidase [Desulfococcaceae bacterium HSG9]